MKNDQCRFVEENLWPYLDRELTAKKVAEISLHLKSCSPCQKLHEARAREAALYRSAFLNTPFGDGFAKKFQKRLEVELEKRTLLDPSTDIFTFHPPGPFRRHAVLWTASSCAAALVVAVLLGLVWRPFAAQNSRTVLENGPLPGPIASLPAEEQGLGVFKDGSSAGVVIHRPDREIDHGYKAIEAGSRFTRSNGGQELCMELLDGTRLVFAAGPLDFLVSPDLRPRGSFSGELRRGKLAAHVVPQGENRTFEISTPHARVKVVGTRFELEVTEVDGQPVTRLAVREGKVLFLDGSGDTEILVTPETGSVTMPLPSPLGPPEGTVPSPLGPPEGTVPSPLGPPKGTVPPDAKSPAPAPKPQPVPELDSPVSGGKN
ncbi:MAG: FecR domain-containing protein [Planctomycetes bacterium]|nr:FecR domain-containing protein [Planctomycetota bacterium]